MIDIHSHILYGLDDGSKTLEQSIEMVRLAAASGTTDIVATPHSSLEYKFQPELVQARIAELQKAAGPSPRIHYGCDFHLSFDNIQDAVAHPGRYSINHKGYLLVEFSDLAIFHTTSQIFEQLLSSGLLPVITHPERNALLQQRIAELRRWVEMGCSIQITGQSFLGRFGTRAQRFSELLVKEGLAHFVASDAHDLKHRPPDLSEVRSHLASRYGESTAQALLIDNPRCAIEGTPLPQPVSAAPRKWYRFWA